MTMSSLLILSMMLAGDGPKSAADEYAQDNIREDVIQEYTYSDFEVRREPDAARVRRLFRVDYDFDEPRLAASPVLPDIEIFSKSEMTLDAVLRLVSATIGFDRIVYLRAADADRTVPPPPVGLQDPWLFLNWLSGATGVHVNAFDESKTLMVVPTTDAKPQVNHAD